MMSKSSLPRWVTFFKARHSPGDVSWVLHVHIVCLNYDGNAFDLCLLAAIAALEERPLEELVTGTLMPY